MAKLLRGFRDLFESESQKLTKVENVARTVFAIYGAKELRLPTLELKEIFIKATGQTTDIVQKEMYAFEDAGGRLVALRPEGTPGVARAYIENNFQANPLQKFFYIGNMFRAERPQAMRLRGMNITELAERSGLNKSTVSRYLSGTCIPRSKAIEQMAIVLTFSPAWVLGYDVTMDGEEIRHIDIDKLTDLNKEKIFAYYQALLDSQGGEDR